MLPRVMANGEIDWEELARREPYFAVLATDGADAVQSSSVPTEAFYSTGEADVAALLQAIPAVLARRISLHAVLDFGCGAGRLTLPLARRATRVVACDVAPTMLSHVRRNAAAAGLQNISVMSPEELRGAAGSFDFVCSLLVLQYIPPATGYVVIRTLMDVLAPGGVAALDIPLAPPLTAARYARAMRVRSQFGRGAASEHSSTVQRSLRIYQYSQRQLVQAIESAGAHVVARLPAHEGEQNAAVLIVEKQ
jgi:SAM-dependent methyltransferase